MARRRAPSPGLNQGVAPRSRAAARQSKKATARATQARARQVLEASTEQADRRRAACDFDDEDDEEDEDDEDYEGNEEEDDDDDDEDNEDEDEDEDEHAEEATGEQDGGGSDEDEQEGEEEQEQEPQVGGVRSGDLVKAVYKLCSKIDVYVAENKKILRDTLKEIKVAAQRGAASPGTTAGGRRHSDGGSGGSGGGSGDGGEDSAKIPLDSSYKGLFKGYRQDVLKAIGPIWFKHVGKTSLKVPYRQVAPDVMRACNVDPLSDDRAAFDLWYRSETGKVQSKLKNQMSGLFVDAMLTLYDVPPIVDASSNPPHIEAHKTAFALFVKPPPAFNADDARFKYMLSWHAGVDPATNTLMAFNTPQCAAATLLPPRARLRPRLHLHLLAANVARTRHGCLPPRPCSRIGPLLASRSQSRSRKLLDTDFFARCAAKGLLPRSAQRWNLGSLAYFFTFATHRLTIRRGADGSDVYGNLKDDGALAEVEHVCEWLMDEHACPTTWPALLAIRRENPMYGQQSVPTSV